MSKVEVLISTMHQENLDFVKETNAQYNTLIAN